MHQINLLPKQWEVFNPLQGVDFDVTLYQGGFGSGKTYLGSVKGLKVLAQNHGATWLVGADSWSRLKVTTWETYLDLLHEGKVKHKANKSDHIITIPAWGDAKVMFRGIDDPQAMRSMNGIGGHLEEASLISEAAFLEFLGRTRQSGTGNPIEVILTTNPEASKGWLYTHFKEGAGIQEIDINGKIVRVSKRRVIAPTLDNPHVPPAYIANLKATYDDELWRILVLGEDGDYTKGLVSFNFSDLNITDTPYKRDLPLYLTCDFNVDPNSWAVAHRYNGEYHFIDELVIENSNNDEGVDEFIRRYPDHEAGVIITGDASGNARNVQNSQVGGTSYTQMMNRFKFHHYNERSRVRLDVRQKNPHIQDRIAAWNGCMCNTDGVRRIFINPKCKWLIHNLRNLKYKAGTGIIDLPTHNDIKKDAKEKFYGHIFDAASYLIEKYDPVRVVGPPTASKVVVPKALQNYLRR